MWLSRQCSVNFCWKMLCSVAIQQNRDLRLFIMGLWGHPQSITSLFPTQSSVSLHSSTQPRNHQSQPLLFTVDLRPVSHASSGISKPAANRLYAAARASINWWPPTSNKTTLTLQHIGTNKPPGSSARCGTSHFTGPSATEAKVTHGVSPDNRLHRADSLACSHTGPLRGSPDNRLPRKESFACSLAGSPCISGQQAAQDGLTRLQPRRISMPLRTTGCPGRTHLPSASPDLCTTPDSQQPRMDSLACSSTGTPASSPTDYLGTQTPVAGRTDPARHRQPNTATLQHTGRKSTPRFST